MTTNITQRTGANGLQSSFAASAASTFSVSTNDPSLSVAVAPALTVMLGFGKQSGLLAVPRSSSLAYRQTEPAPVEARSSDGAETGDAAPHPDEAAARSAGDAQIEDDGSGLSSEDDSPSDDSVLEPASESGASRHRGERRLRGDHAVSPEAHSEPTTDSEPASAEPAEETPPEAEAHPAKPAPSNRLEMTIDSLPHHDLTAPIPIYIDPLGDAVFTATVANLDIMSTGNSIGEALLLLKEQIEYIYGDLTRRQKLGPEQATMLKVLYTYIAPKGAKPAWL